MKNHLSTNTLGIWTSCRGLFPSFRAWLRFRILKKEKVDIYQAYIWLSHLTPHHTHLLFKHQPVEAFVSLKNILQFWEGLIIFCRCHFNWPQRVCEGRHRCPGQSSCHSTCPTPGPSSHERMAPIHEQDYFCAIVSPIDQTCKDCLCSNLRSRQPCPMIRIGPPWVWMLDRESQPIINCSHINGCVRLSFLWTLWVVLGRGSLLGPPWLGVLDQPVIVASVCVADDVVQHN